MTKLYFTHYDGHTLTGALDPDKPLPNNYLIAYYDYWGRLFCLQGIRNGKQHLTALHFITDERHRVTEIRNYTVTEWSDPELVGIIVRFDHDRIPNFIEESIWVVNEDEPVAVNIVPVSEFSIPGSIGL